jgi:hypothetical protein
METRPPKLIEDIVGKLIPPACREHVLGDLYERYQSPVQYILESTHILPFIIASRIRRTFRLELFLSEAFGLYIAFAGAALAGGLEYIYDHAAYAALAIVIATALLVLVLCDAYADPQDQSSRRLRFEVALAALCTFVARSLAQMWNPNWALPMWVMLVGSGVSLPMLMMVRQLFRQQGAKTATSGGGVGRLEELQRRAKAEYRKAWRTNWIWLTALILFLIAFPLFILFVYWMSHALYPSYISATRVWIALTAFGILCVAWVFVRSANLRAARAMRDELEAMDASEDDEK